MIKELPCGCIVGQDAPISLCAKAQELLGEKTKAYRTWMKDWSGHSPGAYERKHFRAYRATSKSYWKHFGDVWGER